MPDAPVIPLATALHLAEETLTTGPPAHDALALLVSAVRAEGEKPAMTDLLTAARAAIPALVLLGDFIGNTFDGKVGIPAFDRCALILSLRAAIAEAGGPLPPRGPARPSPRPDACILVISHRHGVDAALHPDGEAARAALAEYARQWWHEIADDDEQAAPRIAAAPPNEDDEAIRTYFEQADESFHIIAVNLPARSTPHAVAELAANSHEDEGRAPECVLLLPSGRTIRTDTYAANPAGSSYIRVCGPDGDEIAYWASAEWAEDPELVMAAILGAAADGPARVPRGPDGGATLPARRQAGNCGQGPATRPHYTAVQVADALLRNPASSTGPDDLEMLVGEPAGSDGPHRAVRELELGDGTVYRLLIEQARP